MDAHNKGHIGLCWGLPTLQITQLW